MDAWRADCFNKEDTPNLWRFSQQGQIFTKHKSAGNRTYSGLFGLFYGIPASYFNSFKQQNISTVFFSRLKQLDYQINIFNVWSKYENNYFTNFVLGDYLTWNLSNNITRQYQKDQELTQVWLNWHSKKDKSKPWFSFVFYDSLHGPDFPKNYSTTAKPAIGLRDYKEFANQVGKQGFIKSYKIAVQYIDSLANKIFTQLKKSNDLENTIVIITADHGCEWDDNNQGQWGYATNFTDCQVQVPFAIIIPKQFQQQLATQQDNLTTHYDVVPTLMKNFLGVSNDIADYSIGNDLFNINKIQEWSLATSFGQYASRPIAIIEKDKTLRISPSGIHDLIDNFNCLLFNKTVNQQYLDQALEYMTRFIKK
jgi:membrane-anchored protein YejM (alkaline phosphatase superfamily)